MSPVARSIHVACGQIVCRPGDIEGNLRQIRELASQAAAAGAKFILFGESSLNGYLFTREFLEKHPVSADSAPVRSLRTLSRRLGIAMAVGAVEKAAEGIYVSQFVIFPDGRLLVQRKNNLTDTEKKAAILAGPEERTIFTIDGVSFGICICADSGIRDIRDKLAARGCQVFCGPCAGGAGRKHLRKPEDMDNTSLGRQYLSDMEKVCFAGKTLLKCRENRMALICTNLAGDDGVAKYHPGHSMIIDSRGWVVAMRPGEYVAEYLVPQMIHGVIVVQPPKVATRQSSRPAKRRCCRK